MTDNEKLIEGGLNLAPWYIQAWRKLRLVLHLCEGLLTVLLLYPFLSGQKRKGTRRQWSQRLLNLLGIELRTKGVPISAGAMLVANHVSWLDIFVINALQPAAFVSKAEVREWPLIGWLAARNETVFLKRGSRGHAKIINAEIAALLDAGHNVAVFPEGTTTDGRHVLHFHSALLQPAIACSHAIQPLALRYETPDGRLSLAPAYDGDISLAQCMAAIIAQPRLIACVEVFSPIQTDGAIHRREIALQARAAIIKGAGARGCGKGQGQTE